MKFSSLRSYSYTASQCFSRDFILGEKNGQNARVGGSLIILE